MRKTILTVSLVMVAMTVFANVRLDGKALGAEKALGAVEAFELSSFCKAIMKGDLEMVQKMIALGEDVNQKSLGKTPAHYAARYNKSEILQLLIDHGANLKKRCDKGYTVKKYAELSQAMEALEVINAAMKR